MDWTWFRVMQGPAKFNMLSYLIKLFSLASSHLVCAFAVCEIVLWHTSSWWKRLPNWGFYCECLCLSFVDTGTEKDSQISCLLYLCRCLSSFSLSLKNTADFRFCLSLKKHTAIGKFVNTAQGNLYFLFPFYLTVICIGEVLWRACKQGCTFGVLSPCSIPAVTAPGCVMQRL